MPDSQPLCLPCGGCLGCRTEKARQWALRCHLELQAHDSATFTTLTYAPDSLPPTLEKEHVAGFVKRLRKKVDGRLRFFASGEYGGRTGRPHYHAILYGTRPTDAQLIERTWGRGQCRTEEITPRRIAYVAGYCQKKIGFKLEPSERVDPDTGEVYTWQPPFIQMSRNPGIGAHAKEYASSWRTFGVLNGRVLPAPRYLHAAWKDKATPLEIESLLYEKSQHQLTKSPITHERLRAAEEIAVAQHRLRSEHRPLDS